MKISCCFVLFTFLSFLLTLQLLSYYSGQLPLKFKTSFLIITTYFVCYTHAHTHILLSAFRFVCIYLHYGPFIACSSSFWHMNLCHLCVSCLGNYIVEIMGTIDLSYLEGNIYLLSVFLSSIIFHES